MAPRRPTSCIQESSLVRIGEELEISGGKTSHVQMGEIKAQGR